MVQFQFLVKSLTPGSGLLANFVLALTRHLGIFFLTLFFLAFTDTILTVTFLHIIVHIVHIVVILIVIFHLDILHIVNIEFLRFFGNGVFLLATGLIFLELILRLFGVHGLEFAHLVLDLIFIDVLIFQHRVIFRSVDYDRFEHILFNRRVPLVHHRAFLDQQLVGHQLRQNPVGRAVFELGHTAVLGQDAQRFQHKRVDVRLLVILFDRQFRDDAAVQLHERVFFFQRQFDHFFQTQ